MRRSAAANALAGGPAAPSLAAVLSQKADRPPAHAVTLPPV